MVWLARSMIIGAVAATVLWQTSPTCGQPPLRPDRNNQGSVPSSPEASGDSPDELPTPSPSQADAAEGESAAPPSTPRPQAQPRSQPRAGRELGSGADRGRRGARGDDALGAGGRGRDTTGAGDRSNAGNFGNAAGGSLALASSVHMIGDCFVIIAGDPVFNDPLLEAAVPFPNAEVSVVGRVKAAENNSPFPTNRVFLDYTAYRNVPLTEPATHVMQYVPGVERTLFDGMMSVEARLPFAQTLSNRNTVGTRIDNDSWELGNLHLNVKTLLYEDPVRAVAMGLGIRTPTADDFEFADGFGGEGAVENEAVHLLPYIGLAHAPTRSTFVQAYFQVDVDANGNPVVVEGQRRGVLQDQTLIYADAAVGARFFDNPYSRSLRSVVGVAEVHWTTAVQDADPFITPTATLTGLKNDVDIVTGTLGVHLLYTPGMRVTFAVGLPLASDRFADSEFRMMVNWGEPMGMGPTWGSW